MDCKSLVTRAASALAIASCLLVGDLVAGPLTPATAQGLDIFSGVSPNNRLRYSLDFFGEPRRRDRYRLNIPRSKLPISVAQLTVAYPDYFDGRFDVEDIVVEVEGEEVELDEIVWDEINYELLIYPTQPIQANSRVEIIMSNVRNPRDSGFYYFHALVLPSDDIPLQRYVGTWVIGIGMND